MLFRSAAVMPLDPNTFQIVSGGMYVKDKNSVYDYRGELMEGINPNDCTEGTLSSCNPTGFIPF